MKDWLLYAGLACGAGALVLVPFVVRDYIRRRRAKQARPGFITNWWER